MLIKYIQVNYSSDACMRGTHHQIVEHDAGLRFPDYGAFSTKGQRTRTCADSSSRGYGGDGGQLLEVAEVTPPCHQTTKGSATECSWAVQQLSSDRANNPPSVFSVQAQ